MKKVFLDTDVILDLLANREPYAKDSATIFGLADENRIRIYTSSLSIANLHYLLCKFIARSEAKNLIKKTRILLHVMAVDERVIDLALTSNFKDFEDAIQYFTAIEHNINAIISRNIKDYTHAKIPVLTPIEFLASLS